VLRLVGGTAQLTALKPSAASSPLTKGAAKPGARNPRASNLACGLEPKDSSYPISAKAEVAERAVGILRAGSG